MAVPQNITKSLQISLDPEKEYVSADELLQVFAAFGDVIERYLTEEGKKNDSSLADAARVVSATIRKVEEAAEKVRTVEEKVSKLRSDMGIETTGTKETLFGEIKKLRQEVDNLDIPEAADEERIISTAVARAKEAIKIPFFDPDFKERLDKLEKTGNQRYETIKKNFSNMGRPGGGGGSTIVVLNNGQPLPGADTVSELNFVNPTSITYTSGHRGRRANITLPSGGAGSGHTIQEEGTPLTTRDNLNFVGDGVTVTDDGSNTTIVTIPAGLRTEVPTGSVDGSNTSFTVSNTPKLVVIDGAIRRSTKGYTYAAGTITVDPLTPPVYDIFTLY